MKGNHIRFTHFAWVILVILLCTQATGWAQSAKTGPLHQAYAVELNPNSVVNHQLSGQSKDPVQAVHAIAQRLSQHYGGHVASESVGEHYIVLLQGIDEQQAQALANDTAVRSIKPLAQHDQSTPLKSDQRSVLNISVSCSPSGLGSLYECTASVSGGTSPYSYDWEAANSTAIEFGNTAYIDGCATLYGESFRVTATDSASNQDSRIGNVDCHSYF